MMQFFRKCSMFPWSTPFEKVHLKATKIHKKLAVCFGLKGNRSLCMTSIIDWKGVQHIDIKWSYWVYPLVVTLLLSCHIQILEYTALYNYLYVKDLLAWNRHKIWSLSYCNGTWTHNCLVRKQTLNYLAKLASASCTYFLVLPLKSKPHNSIKTTLN